MIKSESSVRPKAIVSTTSSYRGKYAAFSSINNIQDTGFIISKKLLAEDKGYKNALRKIRATEEVKLIIP
ncbi:MAG: hypothetical protein LIP00_10505 [Parabacteroides sp.]|nr:hypothetical protein [Parabacteroides sp.]